MTVSAAPRLPVCYLHISWHDSDAEECDDYDMALDRADYFNRHYGHTYQFTVKHSPCGGMLPHRHVIAVSDLKGRHVGYVEQEDA